MMETLRLNVRMIVGGVLLAALVAVLLALPVGANASQSPYCGTWLGSLESCFGASRTLYAVQGEGEQHSVCVGTSNYENVGCSSGPGHYVYEPEATAYVAPWIQNNATGSNLVHGTAYQP
jgi:hypothetical protein